VAARLRATGPSPSLDEAYRYCASLTRGHYENFTVASFLLPRDLRAAFHAVYAFCRHTDDIGDEADGDRLAQLDAWEAEFAQAYDGTPSHLIIVALQDVIRRFEIPDEPFRKLIQANRMDQGTDRFVTYSELQHYCEHSALPVGRMVLHLIGETSPESVALSDATCTGLQLVNFWQDVRRDQAEGRIYLPLEDMASFGYTEAELAAGVVNEAFRKLMRFEVGRAQEQLEQGAPLANRVSGRGRLALALFTKGGLHVLEAIREQNYDVLSRRPTVSATRKLWLGLSTAFRLGLGRSA